MTDDRPRCAWADGSDLMRAYHDTEWGVPLHDDRLLFEQLSLEGAQAGLSWRTVLGKREAYRRAFHGFDLPRVAAMGEADIAALLTDPGLIRHRQKLASVPANARAALTVIAEFGSLDAYMWRFVAGRPAVNHWTEAARAPARTEVSDRLSKELRHRGFGFVGSTICYAFMQASGMVDDHETACFRRFSPTRS